MRRAKGFTLIELLVVISIIALLMAILMPTLQRVGKQAKAVVCQSHLRQWGTIWAMIIAENNGQSPRRTPEARPSDVPGWWGWHWGWQYMDKNWLSTADAIRCCPMAAKSANPTGEGNFQGGTFLAWGRWNTREYWQQEEYNVDFWERSYGSYGTNWYGSDTIERYWSIYETRGRNNIPVSTDSSMPLIRLWVRPGPPQSDSIPTRYPGYPNSCINRHNGGVNGLFLDWSVRKVGLKELWTLKWNPEFDTANEWTIAGGVKPEDWPEWMRSFKDY